MDKQSNLHWENGKIVQRNNTTELFGVVIKLLLLVIVSFFVLKWTFGGVIGIIKPSWLGTFYFNKDNLTRYTINHELGSIDECRDWVEGQADLYNIPEGVWDYECGKNCKYKEDSQMYLCQETLH